MPQQSPYDQFMAAFNDVEGHLNRVLYGSRDAGAPGFRKMLDQYRSRHSKSLLPRDYDELVVLADLRNALTHGLAMDDARLAQPTSAAVEAMRRVRDRFLRPPTCVNTLRQSKPLVVDPDSSVRDALDQMYDHEYSQLPVYDGDTFVGLLTTNTVARWVGQQMRELDGLAEDASVRNALAFQEGQERVVHVAKTISTTEALRTFTLSAERGEPLIALIITNSGKRTEKPLAVVVAADLPVLAGA